MSRFSLTLSVLVFFLLLILQGNNVQVFEPAEDSAMVATDIACDTDNGSDDSVLLPERISLTPLRLCRVVAFSLPAPVLALPVSSSLIRAPPVMPA